LVLSTDFSMAGKAYSGATFRGLVGACAAEGVCAQDTKPFSGARCHGLSKTITFDTNAFA
jgi:hypothetical protein